MLNIKVNVDSLEKLQKYINFVESMNKMKTDKDFQNHIKIKCWETLDKIMNNRLIGTTNDESIGIYRTSNHIKDTDDGFIIYNDAKIPANVKGRQNDVSNYPEGMFNLALAFEYGVGIVGMSTNNPNAWEYNINTFKQLETNYGKGYNFGWILPKEVAEKYGIPQGQEFAGYRGLEIYRYTAEEIQKQLKSWIIEYKNKKGGVSE